MVFGPFIISKDSVDVDKIQIFKLLLGIRLQSSYTILI
ncbi:MAG: hypothetical protein [Olavius algarvensis Gamma 1 endosymbiont]|nr:MAG: hypothetical protein [Olavius algarvensis Gamma 1 endosymbiont]